MTRWPSARRGAVPAFQVWRAEQRARGRACPRYDNGQPLQLDDGGVVREVAVGLGDLARPVVQQLDGTDREAVTGTFMERNQAGASSSEETPNRG